MRQTRFVLTLCLLCRWEVFESYSLAMTSSARAVQQIISNLQSNSQSSQIEAAIELRNLAAEGDNKDIIRKADGLKVLLKLLDSGYQNPLTTVCTETLSCLAADGARNRVDLSLLEVQQRLCLMVYHMQTTKIEALGGQSYIGVRRDLLLYSVAQNA